MSTQVDIYAKIEHLEREVNRYLTLGEIDKPTFDSLKYEADHAIDDISKVIASEHLWGKGGEIFNVSRDDKHWSNLVCAIPAHYARDLIALGNKLAKVKSERLKGHAFYKDVAAFHERYRGFADQLLKLKEKIISTSARRAAKKTTEEKARERKFTEYATLVAVLKAHLDAYVARAGTLAAEDFERWMTQLRDAGWNIDKLAPKPDKDASTARFMAMSQRRTLYLSITDPASNDNEVTRKRSAKKKAEHVAAQEKRARASYMAWIYKMIQKIGKPVTEATMTGDPWINSTLTLVRIDGERQVWHSKMIINRSKYDHLFNQFPSRKVA